MENEIFEKIKNMNEEEVQELFDFLILEKGEVLTCSDCGKQLGDEIGEQCKVYVYLDTNPCNPTDKVPIVELVCPDCSIEACPDLDISTWQEIGLSNGWEMEK